MKQLIFPSGYKKNRLPVSYPFRSILLFFIFTGCISSRALSQQLDSVLAIAETGFPLEKVYVQTDKSVYAGGETVWFKAYITADHLTAPLCKTLYAELINDKGNVLQRRTLPIVLSGAASDFVLPDSLYDARLYIRAYTQWMLNFDSSLLCVKPLYVVPKKAAPKKNVAAVYSLTLFPEGGDLVEHIESVIAFKAVDQDGTPVAIKGDIVNNLNKKVIAFSTVHDGMGTVVIIPMPGETYKAVWKDKAGKPHETPLPAAKKQGVVIHTALIDNRLHYILQRSEPADEAFLKFTVVAQMRHRMMYAATINLSQKTKVTAPLDTDSVPDGIMQITVFNALMQPVAERLVFVNNNSYSFITDLHMAEQNMNKRARSVLQIDVGGKLLTNVSVAVTDADMNPAGKNEETIFSNLLLTSDLKGMVYNPAYYFSNDADSVKEHLDLVMMTNGWRRFTWQQMMTGQWPVAKYQPDDRLSIQGKIAGLSRTMLYNRSITAILKTKSSQPEYFTIPVNDKGEFLQSGFSFFDTAKLYYQLSNDKDKTITSTGSFSFSNSFVKAPLLSKEQIASFYQPEKNDTASVTKNTNIAATRRNEESVLSKTKVLDEVKIITQKKSLKEKTDDEYTSGFFSGGDSYSFIMEEDPNSQFSPGVLQYLQGKVAGLQISTAGGQSATWRGSNTSFFLNEMQADISTLQNINMRDVAMIKVFRPPFMGGTGGGAGGAIAIYTKKGEITNSSFTGLPSVTVYGYSTIRQFYSPDYSDKNAAPVSKDYRVTLYWNPSIYFDKNMRRITLPFYNSDNGKKLRVIVEGINENGVLTREEKIF
jgi:hypothetical protein